LTGLFEAIDTQDSRLVEPGNLNGASVPDIWLADVPGLVGGFIARGACGLKGGGRAGGGTVGTSEDLGVGVDGSGLLGG
jgi:hypothetical protein